MGTLAALSAWMTDLSSGLSGITSFTATSRFGGAAPRTKIVAAFGFGAHLQPIIADRRLPGWRCVQVVVKNKCGLAAALSTELVVTS